MNDIQEEMLARLKEPAMKLEKRIPNTGRLLSNRELPGMHYDPHKEAIFILEKIMKRRNWTVETRDKLQARIEIITERAKA
jgi:hypothetical protein